MSAANESCSMPAMSHVQGIFIHGGGGAMSGHLVDFIVNLTGILFTPIRLHNMSLLFSFSVTRPKVSNRKNGGGLESNKPGGFF